MIIIHEISEQEPFLVINKPAGLPSAPLKSDDKNNALDLCCLDFPELLNVKGKKEIEHGLVHRLDTETEGLLLIAATQEFYDYIQKEQQENRFIKTYKAICNEKPENYKLMENFPVPEIDKNENNFIVSSYFRYFGPGNKEVRPVTEKSGPAALKKIGKPKLYKTEIHISKDKDKIIANCRISSGFKHQVRCHLSWCGYPVIGDKLYNYDYRTDINSVNSKENMKFTADGIYFNLPDGTKKEIKL